MAIPTPVYRDSIQTPAREAPSVAAFTTTAAAVTTAATAAAALARPPISAAAGVSLTAVSTGATQLAVGLTTTLAPAAQPAPAFRTAFRASTTCNETPGIAYALATEIALANVPAEA